MCIFGNDIKTLFAESVHYLEPYKSTQTKILPNWKIHYQTKIIMSRAFINEDQQVDTPFVPPRADLPQGTTNFVTPEGLEALLKEKEEMLEELKELNAGDEHGKLTAIKVLHIKLQMLENRIVTANIIEHEDQDKSEVRFGSTVVLQIGRSKKTREMQIVGVDEADMKEGKIAFTSPLAKVLMNTKVGGRAILKLAQGESVFKVLEIK